MKRISMARMVVTSIAFVVILPGLLSATENEPIKWYGIGGELNGPKRWLGRVGLNEYLGVEVIFAMKHISHECGGNTTAKADCDSTQLDIGGGVLYEIVPGATISPYLAGRFIFTMTGNGDSETSGTIEAASGVEYVIMKRIGLSGELNFSFRTDPTQVLTSTVVRFYFYF